MARTTTKLATGVGGVLTAGGILLFAAAVVATYRSLVIPDRLWAAFFFGGLPLALLGFAVGARYGNIERYHNHYDEETGRIEGHPLGRVVNPLARENSGGDEPPEEFVPSRPLLAAVSFLPSVGIVAFLWWAAALDRLLLGIAAVMFLAASSVAFLVAELLAREVHDDYG